MPLKGGDMSDVLRPGLIARLFRPTLSAAEAGWAEWPQSCAALRKQTVVWLLAEPGKMSPRLGGGGTWRQRPLLRKPVCAPRQHCNDNEHQHAVELDVDFFLSIIGRFLFFFFFISPCSFFPFFFLSFFFVSTLFVGKCSPQEPCEINW